MGVWGGFRPLDTLKVKFKSTFRTFGGARRISKFGGGLELFRAIDFYKCGGASASGCEPRSGELPPWGFAAFGEPRSWNTPIKRGGVGDACVPQGKI